MSQLSKATRPLRTTLSRRSCCYHYFSTVPHQNNRTASVAAARTNPSIGNPTTRHSIQFTASCGKYPSLSNSVSSRHSSSDSTTKHSSGSLSKSSASTDASVNQSHYPDDEHVLDKGDTLDIQSDNSVKGRESRAQNKGGHATTEKDIKSNAERAKKDYPEAPDTVIGMQDERGGKGY